MAMTLYEPVSVVVPPRLCSTPESMDDKSSESDVSRGSSPWSREEVSSTHCHVPVISDDKGPSIGHTNHPLKFEQTTTPPRNIGKHSTTTSTGTLQLSSSSTQQSPTPRFSQTPLPQTSSNSVSAVNTTHVSLTDRPPPSSSPSSSSSAIASAAKAMPPTTTQPQLSINTSNKHTRGSVTPSRVSQPSPITSAATGSSDDSSNSSTSSSNGNATASHSSLQPPMLLTQTDAMAKANENSMLTLGSYVQFMTLQQQGQMSYPALLPSACLPQSVANPPTTLPPQYDNFSQSYSPSLPSAFGCATNKFGGLIPPQLNQGLIALDVPMAAATTPQTSKAGLHNLGMDQHRFMVGAPLSGSLPGHEVAQAVSSVGVPLLVAGRNDMGIGAMGGSVDGCVYKKSRKRPFSEANTDAQDGNDMHGYNCTMRRSVFPSEDHCGGGQVSESHSSSSGVSQSSSTGGGGGSNGGASPHQLKWQAHQVETWHDLCDGALQDIPPISFTVETDKGFVFSVVDDTFVCQKKNHFQVTVTTVFHRTPKFIKIKDGSIQPVDKFVLHLHGVKLESVGTTIKLEQSMTDRRRSEFTPIEVQVPSNPDEPAKRTVCRLHFGETTANNMRKRGKPNPDQKFFSLVVGLHAVCELGSFPVVAHVSERIIVRASNPGNFDNDCDYLWLKSNTPDSIYHHGRVGINTDKPEEALSVNGNIRVTGRIEHPSDMRVKTNIQLVDSGRQLEHVSQLQLYRYQYREGVMAGASSDDQNRQQVGVLAQELRQILPDAVHETNTDVVLADGSKVSKLLVIDKDRILMETIGAVKQLKKIADDLSHRLNAIEKETVCRTVETRLPQKSPGINVTTWVSPFGTLARNIILLLLLCFLILVLLYVSTTELTTVNLTTCYNAFFESRPE